MRESLLARTLRKAAPMLGCLALWCAAGAPAWADTFNVDVATDNGQDPAITDHCAELGNTAHCGLRAAITIGNNLNGAHVINFAAALPTITVINGALPTLAAPFTINGNALLGHPVTVIDGNGHGCLSLIDSGTPALNHTNGANGSRVYNLVIGNCSGAAISANGHDLVFDGNYLGVDSTGLAAMPNAGHGISVSASHVYPDTSSNFLLNLYNSFPPPPDGASTIAAFSSNLVTALASLQPVKITNNLISGNQLNGVEIFSQNLAAVIVSGNKIGTTFTGNAALANGGHGVRLVGSAFANLIGPDNVISGNGGDGIKAESGAVFLPNFIMGNRIGLAATDSSAHIGNGGSGISTDTKPSSDPASLNPSGMSLMIGPSNVISDNQGANNNAFPDTLGADSAGIVITGASSGVKVVGNTIGIGEFPPGTPVASKAYGNAGDGIIVTASGNKIGGSSATDANIVAANARHGIVLRGSSTVGNSVLGNYIGIHSALASNLTLGNGADGIHMNGVSNSAIGGSGATDFNTIAGNGRNGIKLRNGGTTNGWSNLFQRNAIFHNATGGSGGVGIDHDYTENASDALHSEIPQNYVNLDQAPPVICSGPGDSGACNGSAAPASGGGNTTLDWTIATHGPADFRMEFFRIDSADDNSATTMTFLGEQLVTTDIAGNLNSAGCTANRCSASLPVNAGGARIVMTATDITPLTDQPGGGSDWKSNLSCFAANLGVPLLSKCNVNNTSEFSNVASVPAAAPAPVTLAAANITATGATLNGTVSANGASATVTFEYGLTNAYGGVGSPAAATGSPVAASAFNAPVSLVLNGLTCNTTYHFRVDANNGVGGTVNGGDLSFTTAACAASAPSVTTLAASAITTTGATLNGTVSANGATTTVSFEFGPTSAYGGAGSPGTATQSPLSSGSLNAAVSFPLTGLSCNTQYHFRAAANNGVGGTVNGSDLSFTTAACAPSAPSVTTLAASSVTATTAILNGTVSANGASTAVNFNFGLTASYGGLGSPATATQSPLTSGASNAAVSVQLSGLSCGTTYHFQATANNGVGGTIAGADQTFTTAACAPGATTLAASNITATGATLNGTVSAHGAVTTVSFEFGPTSAYGGVGSPAAATQSPLAANASGAAVSYPLTGLTCNTTYHFRVDANNGVGGTVNAGDLSFTTAACGPGAPVIATGAASGISATGATLNGTVSANGAITTVSFDFGLTNAYGAVGSPAGATQNPVAAGAVNAAVSIALSGLSCNTPYHFRANAANGIGGTISGSDATFTTAACPPPGAPAVATLAATSVSASSAVLNGTVSANGAATTVNFEYGATAAYGGAGSPAAASQSPLASNAAGAAVSRQLSGLTCNTTYHFRAEANNGVGGTVNGSDLTFTTAICPNTVAISGHTPNPSTTLQAITVSAGVTPATAAPASPTGSIVVSDGSGATCTIVLPASSCSLAPNSAGAKTLTAAYGGDANFASGSSSGVAHTVNAVQQYSAQTATQSGVATATLSGTGCVFTTAQFIPVAPLTAPAGVSFPHGLFDFKVGGCANGGTATIQIAYPQPLPAGAQYWKYGPTPGPQPAHWYALGSGAPNNLTISGNTVSFTITDGGLGDDDLSANGSIVDQGGIGAAAAGGNGVADIPSLSEAGLMLLCAALLLLGGLRLRRRP